MSDTPKTHWFPLVGTTVMVGFTWNPDLQDYLAEMESDGVVCVTGFATPAEEADLAIINALGLTDHLSAIPDGVKD